MDTLHGFVSDTAISCTTRDTALQPIRDQLSIANYATVSCIQTNCIYLLIIQ